MIRKFLFWLHLIAGLTGGLLIAVMSFTGAALAFEKDIVAWAERDARRVEAPARAPRLSLDEILARTWAAQPAVRVTNVTVTDDSRDAIVLGVANGPTLYANPYTGALQDAPSPRARAFMQTMRNWHTRLNFAPTPAGPSLGAQFNSAANFLFVFLGVSGLVLWWPSAWNARVLRPSLWFNRDARGRARDWNWHNVIGFWSLPLLLLLAGTGVVLSYRWAGDLVFTLAGEKSPGPGNAPAASPSPPRAAPPAPLSAAALTPQALLSAAGKSNPNWTLLSLRFSPALTSASPRPPPARTIMVLVKDRHPWPPFATDTLILDTPTGEVKRTDAFAALSLGAKARRWIRLLHSGEALGWFVQLLSGLACLGGCVLVYTGFALAWRRFFSRPTPAAKNSS